MAKHNKVFPVRRSTLDRIRRGYEIELSNLITIAQSKFRDMCFSQNANYSTFIQSVTHDDHVKKISRAIKLNSVIHFRNDEEMLLTASLTAHVAICCELLNGSNIPFSVLKRENLGLITGRFFDRFENLEEDTKTRDALEFNLHSIDAFRTIQILRGLGLFLRSPENINQLSLGAGSAKKDIRSMHLEPKITYGPGCAILFNVIEKNARNIVIIDGDPSREAEYARMSENRGLPVLAINDDALEALTCLPEVLEKNKLEKRNTVIGLRVDHGMIPDVNDFFRKLSGSIADSADLVITIGSGFDLDDFKGRTKVLLDLHDYLADAGLLPLLIKLHGEGSIEEQWNSQSFGLKDITTYQILYCHLEKRKISPHGTA